MSPTLHTRAPTVFGRPDGPVRVLSEVIARRREGAYWLLSLSAPDIARTAHPGQFVNVAVGSPHTILRRPFSIARVSRQGPGAGAVNVVFDAHGPGTEWLTHVHTHDTIDVVGPLGVPFPLPRQRVNALLVGGGYGVAPLLFLADDLNREGHRVHLVSGAATGERIYNAIEAKRITSTVAFTTEDGSFGTTGRVTDVMERVADDVGADVVYACGPMPMLRAVSELAAELQLPCQVAVEEHMACGVGVCWTCVIPVHGPDGEVQMRRSCIDGPVFNGAKIAWEDSRWEVGPAVLDDEEPADEPVRLTDADLWGEA